VDEPSHQTLLFQEVLLVNVIQLVGLVLDQRRHNCQYGIDLQSVTSTCQLDRHYCTRHMQQHQSQHNHNLTAVMWLVRNDSCTAHTDIFYTCSWYRTVGRTLVFDWRTFPGLCHNVQLTGDFLGVNCPLYVSQHGQLSHSSSWGR